MQASLAACVLAALLATGASLQCERCEAEGTNCTGDPQTCPSGHDSCGIALMESRWEGRKIQRIVKGCGSSDVCKVGSFSAHFGHAMTRTSFRCCVGDACRAANVSVPPADPEPNGRRCPACYALDAGQCREQTVHCTGSETQCIEATGTTIVGRRKKQTVLKGCASESVCIMARVASKMITGFIAELTTATCTAANGAAGGTPGPAGLLLPALAGLLLLQLLS